jgi:hypothetical protein
VLAIHVVQKAWHAVVAALDDMLRYIGQIEAMSAGHCASIHPAVPAGSDSCRA